MDGSKVTLMLFNHILLGAPPSVLLLGIFPSLGDAQQALKTMLEQATSLPVAPPHRAQDYAFIEMEIGKFINLHDVEWATVGAEQRSHNVSTKGE